VPGQLAIGPFFPKGFRPKIEMLVRSTARDAVNAFP
jgi:hypothetical protein